MGAASVVRESRRAAGLTQAELAARAGTSQPTVAAYESGAKIPRADTLERLLAACGRDLVGRRVAPRPTHVPAGPLGRRLRRHRDEVLAIAAEYGAYDVRVFGSVARGEDTDASDIDLIVQLDRGPALLQVGGLSDALSRHLGVGVDVVTSRLLKREVRERAEAEAVPL